MSNFKRQSSWQEDLARNFTRLFSRSKSQDLERTDTEQNISPENEPSGITCESRAEEPQHTGGLDSHEALRDSRGSGAEDGRGEEEVEVGAADDAGGSPSERQPPSDPATPGPGSPTPPVDGFFKRLGSLFHFASKAEEVRGARELPEETRGMTCGPEGSPGLSDTSTRSTGEEHGALPPQEGRNSRREEGETDEETLPVELSPPVTAAQRTAEPHTLPHTASDDASVEEHHADDGGELPADNHSLREEKEEEEGEEAQRRRALACPPVVTHGTYRGLRQTRRMRIRPQVQLHSPIMEGEEAQQSRGSVSGEEAEGPRSAAPLVSHAGEQRAEAATCASLADPGQRGTRAYADAIATATAANATAATATAAAAGISSQHCNSHIPLRAQETETLSTGGALSKDNEARQQTVELETDSEGAAVPSRATGKDCTGRGELSSDTDMDRKTLASGPFSVDITASRMAQTVQTGEISSVRQDSTGSPSPSADAQSCLATGAPGTEGTHLSATASLCCQGSQLASKSTALPISRTSEQINFSESRGMDITLGQWQEYCEMEGNEGNLVSSEDVVDEEALQRESKRMVDDILQNALAALEKIETSEQKTDILSGQELCEQAEAFFFEAVEGNMDSSLKADCLYKEDSTEQSQTIHQSSLLEEAPGRTQAEPSRSTPSSGYESIAGSDTDIRYCPGTSYEGTSHSAPISSQQRETDPEERLGIGYPEEDKDIELTEGNVGIGCSSDSQLSITVTLEASNDQSQETGLVETSREPLSQKPDIHRDSNSIISRSEDSSNSEIAPPASESVVEMIQDKKVQISYVLEDYGVNVSIFNDKKHEDNETLYVTKDTSESNKESKGVSCDNTLFSDKPERDNYHNIIEKNIDCVKEESLEPNSPSHNLSQELMDTTERDVRPKSLEIAQQLAINLEHLGDDTKAPFATGKEGLGDLLGSASSQLENGHSQELLDSMSGGDQSFVLVETYLVSVVENSDEEDFEPMALRSQTTNSAEEEHKDVREASSKVHEDGTQFSTVKAYRCDLDQSQDTQKYGVLGGFGLEGGDRTSALHIPGRRGHLDLLGTSSRAQTSGLLLPRLQELDLHQAEGGFAIISEEDEMDAVFVNDTGPMLSPTARRGKVYPFSLSPIFEEESMRDEEELQVPPATEEETRSVEQQASSILSLLQSVSERLQSSAFSDLDQDSAEEDQPDFLRQGLWDAFSKQEEGDDDDPCTDEALITLLPQPSTSLDLIQGMQVKDESATFGPIDVASGGAPVGLEEAKPCANTNNSAGKINTPMYQYLKSSIVPALETDTSKENRDVLCPDNGSTLTSAASERSETSGKVIPRPTLMYIYDGVRFRGDRREIHGDVEDAAGMVFEQGLSVRVLSGCWLLYVEPGYRGSCVVLEEGETVLANAGGVGGDAANPAAPGVISIRSIRRVVKDDSPPEVRLHPHGPPAGQPPALRCESDRLDRPLSSLSVQSGCWLAYDGAGFSGNSAVVEAGDTVTPTLHSHPVAHVRSLRPLRMGGLRVRRPLDPKMVVYEKPHFQGQSMELLGNTASVVVPEGLGGVCSLRVIGGVWVGYSQEGYRGRQCLLEAGEQEDCGELSQGRPPLLSFRFLQADFLEPSVSLVKNVGPGGTEKVEVVDADLPDLRRDGQVEGLASVCVKNGIWVAYSGQLYTGEQYVLEKGQYPGTLDWAGGPGPVMALRPVRWDTCGVNEPKFLLRAYGEPHFGGGGWEAQAEVPECGATRPASFRVIRGSWLLYDGPGYAGNHFVLREGLYPDLTSCGCTATSIKSLKPIPYSFSDPSITLFSLDACEGVESEVVTSMDGMSNFFTQSLRVNSGLWVVYEYSNFKGRQMLLQTGQYPVWSDHSGWETIGSLHPLSQPKVYVQVRSRALGSVLTTEGTQRQSEPARLLLCPARSLDSQRWLLTVGLLKSKVGKGCLSVIGGKAVAGARVALWTEHGRAHQRWSVNENGTISSQLSPGLVLDIKGGSGIDKEHLVLRRFHAETASQYWDLEVL